MYVGCNQTRGQTQAYNIYSKLQEVLVSNSSLCSNNLLYCSLPHDMHQVLLHLHQASLVPHHVLHHEVNAGMYYTVVGIPNTLAGKSLPSFSCLQWLIVVASPGQVVGTQH